ncbi:NADH dehydrogenase [Flavobacteriaceae bacterium MAR_2010_188]|nr:NADH dehydrogenase [Flavobacteriaceae bacterium MAR_2010_188]
MAKKIVIVGGGFAGVNLAKKLANNSHFEITVVDKNNYNFFTPLIYQVGTGYLDPSSITYPFRNLFRGKSNISFRMGTLLKIVPEENKAILSNGELTYAYLVIATGTHTNYFGQQSIEGHAIPMKTLEDALVMRNLLLQRLEKASRIPDKSERVPWVTMVVAGGGPTGVEISGIFAELRNNTIRKEFPELKNSGGRIYLVNSPAELLSPMSKKSQEYTLKTLKKMGVEVLLNTRVTGFDGEKVELSEGKPIYSRNLIWATGVIGYRFEGLPETCYERGNRVKVDAFNRVEGTENIYVIGDAAVQTSDPAFPTGHPQLAQVAIQQGKHLAKNFKRIAANKPMKEFDYLDKGTMAVIGSAKAVVDLPKGHFNGFFAWLLWALVHLFSLVDYRNRWRTFYNWALAYLTTNQDLRMIIRPKDDI